MKVTLVSGMKTSGWSRFGVNRQVRRVTEVGFPEMAEEMNFKYLDLTRPSQKMTREHFGEMIASDGHHFSAVAHEWVSEQVHNAISDSARSHEPADK